MHELTLIFIRVNSCISGKKIDIGNHMRRAYIVHQQNLVPCLMHKTIPCKV
jgi:hypothetical protein